jgi:hypothetical protein
MTYALTFFTFVQIPFNFSDTKTMTYQLHVSNIVTLFITIIYMLTIEFFFSIFQSQDEMILD